MKNEDALFRNLLDRLRMGSSSPSGSNEISLPQFCFLLPKVELHAHLNGSISPALMRHFLSRLKANGGVSASSMPTDVLDDGVLESIHSPRQRMAHCFQVFDAIYQVMTSISFTVLAVQDMLLHFALENTVWLEVRTSLRQTLRWLPPSSSATSSTAESGSEGWFHHGPDVNAVDAGQGDYLETVVRSMDQMLRGNVVYDLFTSAPIVLSDAAILQEATLRAHRQSDSTKGAENLSQLQQSVQSSSHDGPHQPQNKQLSEEELASLRRWLDQLDEVYGSTLLYAEDPSTLPFVMPSLVVPRHRIELGRSRPSDEWLHVVSHRLRQQMHCRVLVSVNRGAPVPLAEATIDAVEKQLVRDAIARRDCSDEALVRAPCVVGIDFSGNCSKQHFRDFLNVMRRARQLGLALTYHAGEKVDAAEIDDMMMDDDVRPDRWGHLVFTEERQRHRIRSLQTPVELCLSSNALTSFHKHVKEHHLSDFWHPHATLAFVRRLMEAHESAPRASQEVQKDCGQEESHQKESVPWARVSFNTDDSGVFSTSLTKELLLLCQHPLMQQLGEEEEVQAANSREQDSLLLLVLCGLQREAMTHAFVHCRGVSAQNVMLGVQEQQLREMVIAHFYRAL